jgi:hypothetical protein
MFTSVVPTFHYKTDPITGFIMPDENRLKGCGMVTKDGVIAEQTFIPSLKIKLIQRLIELWPNVSKACYEIGISVATYKNHYAIDPLFREHIDEVKSSVVDDVKSFSVQLGRTNKMAIIDRMATLRAFDPENYDRAKIVKVQQEIPDIEGGKKRMKNLEHVIDAEIVKSSMESAINKDLEV